MRAGYISHTREDGIEHIHGWYLELWRWSFWYWKEDQFSPWKFEVFPRDA